MDDATSSSGTGRGDSFAVGLDRPNAGAAALHRVVANARRYALVGVGLFGLAWLLGGIGETQGLFALVPFADISLSLGFVLALFGAVMAGTALREIVPVAVIAGIGHFYKGQDHMTHVMSGLGFGLEHTAHVILGLFLIGVATAIAAFFAFHRTEAGVHSRGT